MEDFKVIELTSKEMIKISGGLKSLAYYFGYAVGFVCGETITLLAGIANGLHN